MNVFGPLQKLMQGALSPGSTPQDETARLRLATAVLLVEAAQADSEFHDAEREALVRMLRARFGLDAAGADDLLSAAEQARWESGDLYQFARQINDSFPLPRKLAIVELLWEIVYSDGALEVHEDALMHKMGNLLGIRLEDLMALKRKVRGRMPG
ncbi:MAG: TerB family tellurite resistance protein [bacterium]|nr:TerB family tellurite resistance protein [bacterium]